MPNFSRLALTTFLVALGAVIPLPAFAAAFETINDSALPAWVTIQNQEKTQNLAAFRVNPGSRGWKVLSSRVLTNYYVRFQFMNGQSTLCDTKARVYAPNGGRMKAVVRGIYKNNHCFITSHLGV